MSCATASIVPAAVPAAASAAVPVAVSISLNRMRSHAHARGGAGGAGFSLCSSVAGGALATSWRGGDDLPRPGHGALVALSSWPVVVRRRVLGAFLLAVPPVLVARGAAWRVAWQLWRVQALCAVGLKRGAGLTLKMKTRVDARLLVAPRGATCWYGSTHASSEVRWCLSRLC